MSRNNQPIRILFVEDLPADVEMARREIKKGKIDFTYRVTDTEPEFRKLLEEFDPEVVVSDYSMPSFDGMTALKISLAVKPHTPFVVLTGSMNEETAVACMKAGATDYVIKEQIKRLPFAVKDAIEKSQSWQEKEKMQAQLRENEEMYRSLIENSGDAIYLLVDRKFEVINSGFVKMFGYSLEDLNQPDFDFIHLVAPENREFVEKRYEKVHNGEKVDQRYEFTAFTNQGKRLSVEASISYLDFKGARAAQGIIRDVTERKQAEQLLKESEARFRQIFDSVKNIAVQGYQEDGTVHYWNKASEYLYGYTAEEAIGKKLYNLIIPDEMVDGAKKSIENMFKTEIPIPAEELNLKRKNGSLIPVYSNHTIVNVMGRHREMYCIDIDLTERKKAEEELRLLSRSVEESPVGILITDSKGIIEYTNPMLTKITGYSLAELKGKLPPQKDMHSEEFYKNLWETINSGKQWSGEYTNKKKNGDIFWEKVSISPIFNKNGEITHFMSVSEDITEKKKMIEELVKAKDRAEESDRLKSAFLANMSHEIRTPMNGILGFTGLLKEPKLTGDEKNQYVDVIERSGERMLNTINDLIEISKIESGTMEVVYSNVNINETIDFFFTFFKPEVEKKGLEFSNRKALPDAKANIKTDKEKLHAVITNLIKNAVKYTSSGYIKYGYRVKESGVEFYVKDSGIGIEEKRHKAVFDRFVQADNSYSKPYEGAGLGLAITKAYVEMLGGEIWVISEPGKGSEFVFLIPHPNAEKQNEKANHHIFESTQVDNKLKNLNILIAEDDEVARLYLTELLDRKCKHIWLASNGLEAVELFDKNRDIDLILMDMKMPLMDGYAATQKIKEMNSGALIIAQTAYALRGDNEIALAAGCDDYLTKPLKKDNLLKLIDKYF